MRSFSRCSDWPRESNLEGIDPWRKSWTRQGSQARIDVVISGTPPKFSKRSARATSELAGVSMAYHLLQGGGRRGPGHRNHAGIA